MRVFIDGAVGTTGLEIRTRLADRRDLTLLTLDDADRKNIAARRAMINAADIVILCLPDDAAVEAVTLIESSRVRVIDASTAHRCAPNWVYGFPEVVGREVVSGAMRLSNPGCYATGFIALVAPLVRAGLIDRSTSLTCNAVSGYTGGGKAMIAEFERAASPTAFRTYALTLAHKHVPEMQIHCSLVHAPLFAPAVAATPRGMIVDVPLFGVAADAARETLREAYAGSTIVKVRDLDEGRLTIEHAAGTDRLDLFVFGRADGSQCRLVAALDNLGKGASGAAIQSLNLMAGLSEATGLRL